MQMLSNVVVSLKLNDLESVLNNNIKNNLNNRRTIDSSEGNSNVGSQLGSIVPYRDDW